MIKSISHDILRSLQIQSKVSSSGTRCVRMVHQLWSEWPRPNGRSWEKIYWNNFRNCSDFERYLTGGKSRQQEKKTSAAISGRTILDIHSPDRADKVFTILVQDFSRVQIQLATRLYRTSNRVRFGKEIDRGRCRKSWKIKKDRCGGVEESCARNGTGLENQIRKRIIEENIQLAHLRLEKNTTGELVERS